MLYPRDPKVVTQKSEETLSIEWKWKNENGVPMALSSIMLTISAVMVVVLPDKPGQEMSHDGRVFFYVLMILVVPTMYIYCLSCFLNRTKIHADRERLVVKTSPFPWFKRVVIASEGITQFFVVQARRNSRKHWTLYCLGPNSNYFSIGQYFPSEFAAYQICHELQDFYGLEDLPVYGQTNLPHQSGPRKSKP